MLFKKKEQYVVARKNVYAGQIVANEHADHFYRGGLFTIDDDGFANDLRYDTPRCPIILSRPENHEEYKVVANSFINLEPLLIYLNYKEHLTQSQINRIFKLLVTNEYWISDHKSLFENGGPLSRDLYSGLFWLSFAHKYKPHKEEQAVQLIKKRK